MIFLTNIHILDVVTNIINPVHLTYHYHYDIYTLML